MSYDQFGRPIAPNPAHQPPPGYTNQAFISDQYPPAAPPPTAPSYATPNAYPHNDTPNAYPQNATANAYPHNGMPNAYPQNGMPPYTRPSQSAPQMVTPVITQPVQGVVLQSQETTPPPNRSVVYCGAVILSCAGLTLIMCLVFFIKYPTTYMYVTLPLQAGLGALTGGLLVGVRNASNPSNLYCCSIFFGVGCVIISLFHVANIGQVFASSRAMRYIAEDGVTSLACVFTFSALILASTLLGMALSCGQCCSGNRNTNTTTVSYVQPATVVVPT